MKLAALRLAIDLLDSCLCLVVRSRSRVVAAVAAHKRRSGMKPKDVAREVAIGVRYVAALSGRVTRDKALLLSRVVLSVME